jgi:4-carboxymuconolactone decarboxylase
VDESRYDKGMRVRRSVLGDAYVDQALARVTELDADFQRLVTETAWGSVWSRPGLDRRTRSLITVAILAALGRQEELALHLRATRNTGAQPDEIAEALMHVAVYAGIPAALSAFAVAKRELGAGAVGESDRSAQAAQTHGGEAREGEQ